jgi:hypothetical protein
MPAYNLSFIRKNINSRNAILVHSFLTTEAKDEYDSIYNYLEET